MPDREDDGLLDRLIGQILEQPFPEDPPQEVRRRVLALGQPASRSESSDRFPSGSSLSAWLHSAAVVACFLVVTNLSWRLYVSSARPVCWIRTADSETWLVVYENAHVEISSPPKSHKGR